MLGSLAAFARAYILAPIRLRKGMRGLQSGVRFFLLLIILQLPAHAQWWSVQTSGLDTNLRGVSAKYDQGSEGKQHYIIWASARRE